MGTQKGTWRPLGYTEMHSEAFGMNRKALVDLGVHEKAIRGTWGAQKDIQGPWVEQKGTCRPWYEKQRHLEAPVSLTLRAHNPKRC